MPVVGHARRAATYRLVEGSVGAYARLDAVVASARNATRLFADGLLGAALDADEKMRLTIRLYDLEPRIYRDENGLWDWEERWFARVLPPPPARILVGAAGAGREAVALARRGWRVAAFEPGPELHAAAVRAADGRFPVVCADYEHVVRAAAAGEVWDAVLFGWTSFSHLLVPADRARFLAAADRLAPRGPILLSYVARLGQPGAPSSRIWRTARRLGRTLGRMRGVGASVGDDGEQFDRAVGFVRPFAPDELHAMAAALGRRAMLEPDSGFPHATFVR